MRKLLFLMVLPLILSCGRQCDVVGKWTRFSEEPSMFLRGEEILEFKADSTFSMVNVMQFEHSDSALRCSAPFTIAGVGRWYKRHNGDIVMVYSPDEVKVETDPDKYLLTATVDSVEIADSIADNMRNELIESFRSYYSEGFDNINKQGGLVLKDPKVTRDGLYSTIGGAVISWTMRK